MFIEIKKMFSDRAEEQHLEFSFDFSGEQLPGYIVQNPCQGIISLYPEGEVLRMVLKANPSIIGNCARCLTDVIQNVKLERTVIIQQSQICDEDEDLPFTKDEKLDAKAFVLTEIFTSAPTLLLCSKDCKGICPICGKHRDENCGCENQPTDERLAILKQLLS